MSEKDEKFSNEEDGEIEMAEWINDFSANDIAGHGAVLIGDKAERDNTVKYLLSSWDGDVDGPLIVLDLDGSLFAKFGGKGILVDLVSANAVLPDYLAPVLAHRRYGRTPKSCAKFICDIAVKERKDRNSNDAFWSYSGRQTLKEYTEYSLLFAYLDKCNGVATGNTVLDAARSHRYLFKLMSDFSARGAEEAERWNPPEAEDEPLIPLTRRKLAKRPKPLSEQDKALQAELERLYGQGSVPFDDTLASYAKNGMTNTPNCILKTAMSMGQRMLDFNERLEEDFRFYKSMPALDLEAFVLGNKIMYIVQGNDKDVSSLFGLMTLLGAATAADTNKVRVTCLIPDIAGFDIFEGVCGIGCMFPKALRWVIGCSDFMRASRRTDLPPTDYFDRLSDVTGQHVVWHKSKDAFLKQLFQERTAGQNLMYGLNDLGGNHMATAEEGGEVQYAYMPDASEIEHTPGVREERAEDSFDAEPLWFFAEKPVSAFEKLCEEFDFDEDEDILTQNSNGDNGA